MGLVVHAVPMTVTWLITRLRLAPAVMASVMPVAAALVFAIAFVVWTWIGWVVDRGTGAAAFALLFPITFIALIIVAERTLLWRRGLQNRVFARRRGAPALKDQRDLIVSLVADDVLTGLEQSVPTAAGQREATALQREAGMRRGRGGGGPS